MPKQWTPESWEEASGRGQDEHYLTAAIKAHLLTEPQRQQLYALNLDIADVLNGRYGDTEEPAILAMFGDWNTKLGWKEFGF